VKGTCEAQGDGTQGGSLWAKWRKDRGQSTGERKLNRDPAGLEKCQPDLHMVRLRSAPSEDHIKASAGTAFAWLTIDGNRSGRASDPSVPR